jgi:hypothetical protein
MYVLRVGPSSPNGPVAVETRTSQAIVCCAAVNDQALNIDEVLMIGDGKFITRGASTPRSPPHCLTHDASIDSDHPPGLDAGAECRSWWSLHSNVFIDKCDLPCHEVQYRRNDQQRQRKKAAAATGTVTAASAATVYLRQLPPLERQYRTRARETRGQKQMWSQIHCSAVQHVS